MESEKYVWKPQLDSFYREQIDAVEKQYEFLQPWEKAFLVSTTYKLMGKEKLTEEDADMLERIYFRYTD
jgi:hypothetical protein